MQRLIEVRLLVAIVTLSEELNFTNAAKRLGITQSGLSRRVASLEKKYRIELFERDHANVTLTEAGRVFVEEAKLSLMHDERAIEMAKAVTEGCGISSHHRSLPVRGPVSNISSSLGSSSPVSEASSPPS